MNIKKKSVLIISIIIIIFLMSGCSNTRIVDSKIKNAISDKSSSQDTMDWLIANEEMVVPVLVDRLSSENENKVTDTTELLKLMGDYGSKMILKNFIYLNDSGKHAVIEMIASGNDKDSVIQLLALSTVEGGFDKCVEELIKMKDSSKEYIMSMLYLDAYYDTINAVVAGYGTSVVEDIIPLIYNADNKIENRALEILSLAGGIITEPLIDEVLNNSVAEEQAKKIAENALINTKEESIDYIIEKVSNNEGDANIAGIMLYELSKEDGVENILKKCASSQNTESISEMLKKYADLSGIEGIVNLALTTDDSDIMTAASLALSDSQFAQAAFVAIVNQLETSDTETSKKYELCNSLIYDDVLSTFAKSIISQNSSDMTTALSSGYNPDTIGEALTQTSDNEEVVTRIDAMLNEIDDLSAKNVMMVLCSCEDSIFPSLTWKRYANGSSTLSEYAMDIILEATPAGTKYNYLDMDFLPYAKKLVSDLKSKNEFTKSAANQMLNKVSEGVEHHDFYQYVFDNYPNQSTFQVLCWHYAGEEALPIQLKIDGTDEVVNTVSYEIADIDVSDVDEESYPSYDSIVKTALSYMGLNVVDECSIKLSLEINEEPKSKSYKGLIGKSYLGAESECVITVYIDDKKASTFKGKYTIDVLDEKPVGDSVSEYMEKPEDAPIEEAFIVSYVEALYETFGIEALYGTYQSDRSATLEVASSIWD